MNQKVVTENFIIEPTGDKYFKTILFIQSKKRKEYEKEFEV